MKLEEPDWKALARLATSPDGQRLLALLKANREECRDNLEQADTHANLCKFQGAAGVLKALIRDIESARDVVNKHYS